MSIKPKPKDTKRTPESAEPVASKAKSSGLETLHVFLDTQVFRQAHFDLNSALIKRLAELIEDRGVKLHVTDITMAECERQLMEEAHAHARHLVDWNKAVERWAKRAPSNGITKVSLIDGEKLGEDAIEKFRRDLTWAKLKARIHAALDLKLEDLFPNYLARKAPFEKEGSKEFPDAAAVLVLGRFCKSSAEKMYVVSKDQAMRSAAEQTGVLLPLESLTDLLELAVEADQEELRTLVSGWLEQRLFRSELNHHITGKSGFGEVYAGDKPEGEVLSIEIKKLNDVSEFRVIGATEDEIRLVATLQVKVEAEYQWEDRDQAIYDKEDGIYFGAETVEATMTNIVPIRVLLTVDRESETILDLEMITRDIAVSEDMDDNPFRY